MNLKAEFNASDPHVYSVPSLATSLRERYDKAQRKQDIIDRERVQIELQEIIPVMEEAADNINISVVYEGSISEYTRKYLAEQGIKCTVVERFKSSDPYAWNLCWAFSGD
jgi:hypothetical protein